MIHDPIPRGVQPPLPLLDDEALDIADYLKSEQEAASDIHDDATHRQGLATLSLGAIGVVYGDTAPRRSMPSARPCARPARRFRDRPRCWASCPC